MFVPLTPLEFRQRAVSLYGAKTGIVDGEKRFTYGEFDLRINRLANSLSSLGIVQGDVVSFLTYNSHQLLEAYYAVPQIMGILNPINIRLNSKEIEYIIKHAKTKILIFHYDFLHLVEIIRERLPQVEHYIVMESKAKFDWTYVYETLLEAASPEVEINLDSIDENAIIELFYTSGTTGPPKGVTLTSRGIYLHTMNAIIGFQATEEDVLLHIVPLFHVNGWGTPQFLTAVGGRHVMLRKMDYGNILRLIEVEGVTKLLGVPTIFNGLLQHNDLHKYDLSSLNEIVIGGAPSSYSLIEELEDKIGCRAYVGYGLTETSPFIAIARPKSYQQTDKATRRSVQVKTGTGNVGIRARVVDTQGNDVPRDEKTIGEIIVRSNTVMDGYLKDQEATDAVIINGWFHTGDMAVMDDEGYFTIVDRKKDIIISGGENISSVEVEKVIQDHPAVFEAVVIGVPDDKWGEVGKAFVVLKPDAQIADNDILQHLRANLANFKVPKSVEFLDEFHKGGSGKILKQELRANYWAGRDKKV